MDSTFGESGVPRPTDQSWRTTTAVRVFALAFATGMAVNSSSLVTSAPLLVVLSYFIGPAPMTLEFWPGAIVMMLIATMAATLMTNGGRSAWFVGVMILTVYAIFAMTLYMLPPRVA